MIKALGIGPLCAALLLALTLFGQPQGSVTRGPESSSQSEEVPEWLRTAVHEQNQRQSDSMILTLLEVGNLLTTAIGFLAIAFKAGKYLEKIERAEKEISNLWKVSTKERES